MAGWNEGQSWNDSSPVVTIFSAFHGWDPVTLLCVIFIWRELKDEITVIMWRKAIDLVTKKCLSLHKLAQFALVTNPEKTLKLGDPINF
jgi:hypothetical protein